MHQSLVGLPEKRYVFSFLIRRLVKGISKKSYIQRMGKLKKMLKNGDVSEFITKNLVIHQLESLIRLLLVTKLLELFIISVG